MLDNCHFSFVVEVSNFSKMSVSLLTLIVSISEEVELVDLPKLWD